MKATGIVRKIDELGRVVIPMELRRNFNWNMGDPLEIYTDRDGEVILKKYDPAGVCLICGEDKGVHEYKGKYVCAKCCRAVLERTLEEMEAELK